MLVRIYAHLITGFEAQTQLVRALYLPVPSELVANCIAQGRAGVIGEGSG